MTEQDLLDKKMIGRRMARYRLDAKLSQKELAKILGVSWRVYQTCEVGQRYVSASILLGFHNIFHVSIEWLLTGDGSRQSAPWVKENITHVAKQIYRELSASPTGLTVEKFNLVLDAAAEQLLSEGHIEQSEIAKYVALAATA